MHEGKRVTFRGTARVIYKRACDVGARKQMFVKHEVVRVAGTVAQSANHPDDGFPSGATHRKKFGATARTKRNDDEDEEEEQKKKECARRVAFHASRIADALDYISIMVIVNLSGGGR